MVAGQKKRLSRAESKEKTRQDLLEAATKLFASNGFEGTSIEEIAESALYSRGAFYAHFADKEALMKAIILNGFDSDIEGIHSMHALAASENMAQAYEKLAQAFYSQPLNLLWMLEFQLSAVRHPRLRQAYAEQHDKLRKSIRHLLSLHLQNSKTLVEQELAEAADLLLVTVSGIGLFKLIHGDKIAEGVFERTFKTIVKGLTKENG